MYLEEIIALTRLSRSDGPVVSDLARAVLELIELLRDASLRADLAEATLEVELQRTYDLKRKIAGFRGSDPTSLSRLLHEIAEVVQR